MTPEQVEKIASKVKAPRFGMLMEDGNGVSFYECKTEKHFGDDCHFKRFRGCYWKHFRGQNKHEKSVYSGGKWNGFGLYLELYRTDYKVTVISETVLDAILSK